MLEQTTKQHSLTSCQNSTKTSVKCYLTNFELLLDDISLRKKFAQGNIEQIK